MASNSTDAGVLDEENLSETEKLIDMVAGVMLASFGLGRRGVAGLASLALGCGLLYEGAKGKSNLYKLMGINHATRLGRSAALKHGAIEKTEQSVSIMKPRAGLYTWWRDFTNLPRIMPTLNSVNAGSGGRSTWSMNVDGETITWEAEIITDTPGQLIAWRSTADATIKHAGSVTFKDAPGGRGTQVTLIIDYEPPMGALGKLAAKLSPSEPGRLAYDSLRRFKQLMETGEISTGQMRPGKMSNELVATLREPEVVGVSR